MLIFPVHFILSEMNLIKWSKSLFLTSLFCSLVFGFLRSFSFSSIYRYIHGFTTKTNCLWKLHCCICHGCKVPHWPSCDGGLFGRYRSARQSPPCRYCSGYLNYLFHCYRIKNLCVTLMQVIKHLDLFFTGCITPRHCSLCFC